MKPLWRLLRRAPDSAADPVYAIQVSDTEPDNRPEFGSVEVCIWRSPAHRITLRLTQSDARDLTDRLTTYFNRQNKASRA